MVVFFLTTKISKLLLNFCFQAIPDSSGELIGKKLQPGYQDKWISGQKKYLCAIVYQITFSSKIESFSKLLPIAASLARISP